jgi:hypothetical protein
MLNKRRMLAFVFAILFCLAPCAKALAADHLEGHVKQNMRITRPVPPGAEGAVQQGAVVSEDSFNLQIKSGQLDTQPPVTAETHSAGLEQAVLTGGAARSAITGGIASRSASPPATPLTGDVQKDQPPGGAEGRAENGLTDDYNARKSLKGSVTFRFCYFDLGDGVECTWEGLRDALYLQGRGVDIALMLDRGGVRLANKHNGHEYQLHRGSTERLVKNQTMLREFIDKGGKVYASERWCKQFGLIGGSYPALTQGVELLGDEDMAELLVDRAGRIVEY